MMPEHDAHIGSYQHLAGLPRADDALQMLRKIASLVKPIMRKRNWHVGTLTEFIPTADNLLGVNYNRGQRICLRLRHVGDKTLFKDLEEVTDTMLHELSHNVHGPHDQKFHDLWNELRDEYTELKIKGYSGEGFLGDGNRLGGRAIPIQEMRRQARMQAERRRALQAGSGQKLGGAPVLRGVDMRAVIAEAASRRMRITRGCGSDSKDAGEIVDQAAQNAFTTKAMEDDANEQAISQALWELMQDEEDRKAGVEPELWIRRDPPTSLGWQRETGVRDRSSSSPSQVTGPTSNRAQPPPIPIHSKPKSDPKSPFPKRDWSGRDWNVLKPRSKSRLISDEEAKARRGSTSHVDLSSDTEDGSRRPPQPNAALSPQTQNKSWSCTTCTLVNPGTFLVCGACGVQRPFFTDDKPHENAMQTEPQRRLPAPASASIPKKEHQRSRAPAAAPVQAPRTKPLGWNCHRCGSFMESQWWTCSACGTMKLES